MHIRSLSEYDQWAGTNAQCDWYLVFQVVAILLVSCLTMSQVQAGFFDTGLMEMERRPQEEYDAFFKLIDHFLWDSEEDVAEERQYYGQYGAPLRRRG